MDDMDPWGGSYFDGPRTVSHPFSERKPAWSVDVRLRVKPRISIGVNAGESNSGSTYGYASSGFLGTHVSGSYSVQSVAPLLSWHPARRLRVGGGPAVHQMRFTSPEAAVSMRKTAFGWMGQAGVAVFDGKRMFSEITAQYRGMPSLQVGTLTVREQATFGSGDASTMTIPDASVRYQHWTIGVSFGIKIH